MTAIPCIRLPGVPAGARVVVAMSGGVDSSVAAALVARAGYEAVGITLQLYDHGAATGRPGSCCAGRDVHDARRVADHLGIPHYVLDFEERFRRAVVEDFAATYAAGRTPVPCIRCNERIKFRDLLQVARGLGAAALVTGHYVRRVEGSGGPELHRAADPAKDQSWFLFATTREQLAFCHFPLGDLRKSETRRIAAALGLPVAEKPESQDICFVPDGDHARIVRALRPDAAREGEILHVDGRVLGRHRGILHYTVGQRRGLGVAAGERLYVVAVDGRRHRIVVGPRPATLVAAARLEEVNWIAPAPPDPGRIFEAKHRHNQPAVPARIEPGPDGGARVVFGEPESGVAPGQACVVYDGTRVLGGGWIAATEPAVSGDGKHPAAAFADAAS